MNHHGFAVPHRGCAYLVVKKNLGADSLAEFIAAAGYPTVRLRSRRGYRVLESRGHDPPGALMGMATGCRGRCRHPHPCTLRAHAGGELPPALLMAAHPLT